MTLPSKRRRIWRSNYKLGDPLAEGTRTLIYGIGMLLLIAAVIVGISSLLFTLLTGSLAGATNWGFVSVGLFIVGIIMKLIGTKTIPR